MVRYPTPYLEGRGRHHRDPRPARPAGGRYPRRSSARSTSPTSSTTRRSTRPASRPRSSRKTEIGDRLDLRDVLTVTIDPATARDFDDAITLSRDERGYWSLGVHIADVSHFVRAGSASTRRPGSAGRASTCPTASSRCSRKSSRTAWRASRPGGPGTPSAPSWSSTPRASAPTSRFARSAIRVDHRFSYEAGLRGDEGPRGRAARGGRPGGRRDARRGCSSWR